jgi:hypothetical protein
MSQTNLKGGLGYEGKVTLTLKSKDRVLKTKTYKNKGTAQLFKFLGYCLIDSYEEAKKLLPSKIMLLYNIEEQTDKPTAVMAKSTFRSYAQTPTIVSSSFGEGSDGWVKVTYSFEVPRVAIEGTFNQIALYGAGITENDITEFSAYHYLKDDFGVFDPQDPETDNWSATTVLLVEWELTLTNMM